MITKFHQENARKWSLQTTKHFWTKIICISGVRKRMKSERYHSKDLTESISETTFSTCSTISSTFTPSLNLAITRCLNSPMAAYNSLKITNPSGEMGIWRTEFIQRHFIEQFRFKLLGYWFFTPLLCPLTHPHVGFCSNQSPKMAIPIACLSLCWLFRLCKRRKDPRVGRFGAEPHASICPPLLLCALHGTQSYRSITNLPYLMS